MDHELIRKRFTAVCVVACMVTAGLSGCSASNDTSEQNDEQDVANYLPDRVEDIYGAISIPEGSEATDTEESDIPLDVLWGYWVAEDENLRRNGPSNSGEGDGGEKETKIVFQGDENNEDRIRVFPKSLHFLPASLGKMGSMSSFSILSSQTHEAVLASQWDSAILVSSDEQDDEYDYRDEFGKYIERQGYGFGLAYFNEVPGGGYSFGPFTSLDNRKIIYSIQGDKLVIGITEIGENESEESGLTADTNIEELQFTMALHPESLELTYGNETITYVPKVLQQGNNDYHFRLEEAGLTDRSTGVDGILAFKITNYDVGVMRDIHEGYVDANIAEDNGIVTIETEDGNRSEYPYIYSGDVLSLITDSEYHTYSNFSWNTGSGNKHPSRRFLVNGQSLRLTGKETINELVGYGFQTDIDLNQPVASGQVTDEIRVSFGNAAFIVRVCNPYSDTTALGECFIASYFINDTSGMFQKGSGIEIGQTSFDEMDVNYDAPYEKTDNQLRYKAIPEIVNIENNVGEPVSKIELSDMEAVFDFDESGILQDFRFEVPALLYNGLQDNIFTSDNMTIDANVFNGVKQTRDTILGRLKEEFISKNINVDINDQTGEIVMGSDILFPVDEYGLTEEGKAALDQFMGVYASVIADGQFADKIAAVRFEGHTDSSGSYEYNLDLSEKRANSVMEYAVNSENSGITNEQRAVMEQVSEAVGYSFSDPVLDANGKEDMDASRRAAIKFFIKIQ